MLHPQWFTGDDLLYELSNDGYNILRSMVKNRLRMDYDMKGSQVICKQSEHQIASQLQENYLQRLCRGSDPGSGEWTVNPEIMLSDVINLLHHYSL